MQTATDSAQAWVCWTMERGHFVRFGSRFYDRFGQEIEGEKLHWRGEQAYRTRHELGLIESLEDALEWLRARYADCGYEMIYLADHEWGNQLMEQIAMEHFAANPECQFVHVYEHAGWHLGFRRDRSIWTTANDMAVLTQGLPYPEHGCQRWIRRS